MNAFEFNLNEELLIELADEECFSGELIFRNKSGTQIELANVRNISTNMLVEGTQIFYCREIVNTTRLGALMGTKDVEPSEDEAEETNPEPIVLLPVTLEPPPPPMRSHCFMAPDQFKRIMNGIDQAVLINSIGNEYREAMQVLRNAEQFALAITTDARAIASVVSLITICTADQRIIQLDIMSIGRIPSELKILLEARVPRKLMHNSPFPAYILQAKCDVKLNGIFDTLLAHAAVKGDNSIVSVTDCVGHYLNIPAVVLGTDHDVDWTKRPLSPANQRVAALTAAFLPALQMHLLHERFLADFYQKCNEFSTCYHNYSDEADIYFQIGSQSNTNFQLLKHTTPTVQCDAVPRETMAKLVRDGNRT